MEKGKNAPTEDQQEHMETQFGNTMLHQTKGKITLSAVDKKRAAPEVKTPRLECEHHYVHCERSWYPAVCCVKCGHTVFMNPNGSISETYSPVHVSKSKGSETQSSDDPKDQDNRNLQ